MVFVAAALVSGQVMPMPWKMVAGTGGLTIDSSFSAKVNGYTDPRLQAAVKRFVERLARQTGIPIRGGGGGAGALIIECRGGGPEYPALGEDESYQLQVTSSGAQLKAQTVTGALRGLETFAQLTGPAAGGFRVPAMLVEDRPRFAWRGLMLDVSRHWMPVAVIERNLDAMAAVKLNVFHWHLSDDQGFRVESLRYPRLQQFGSDGDFYNHSEIRHIIAYARDRGIRIVPEFDMPGHTTSWFAGYPDLASAPGPYRIERAWGIFEPTMDPARETTYEFLDGFIGEMADLFPDRYFHIGGDEIEDAQWKRSTEIQAFAKQHGFKNSLDLHAYFNARVQQILKKHGKTLVGWDEVLRPGMPEDTVIQSWRGPESLADAAQKGYRGILSFGYYLDHLQPASFHYRNDPDPAGAHPSQILGGEACMWSEYVSSQSVDSRIWPRAAAIAERLWSPKDVIGVDSMYTRLEAVSRALEWAGVQHRSNYARMLDRLAAGRPAQALRVLADASESLGIEGRRDARKYTSQVAMNRFVDAVPPESETIRALERQVRAESNLARLRVVLEQWSENHSLLQPAAQDDFLISELLPLSEDLSSLGKIGLQALEYLQAGRAAPEKWVEQTRKRLEEIARPKAEVRLAAARPVRLLVDVVCGARASR